MKIDDAVTIATDTARSVLEDMVRTHKGELQFGSMMVCYRGETPVAMLVLPPNKETILQTAFLAARGFGPDLLALTHDSYSASGKAAELADPRTGKMWARPTADAPGPMQTYVEEFGYDGTVVDCLVTHVVNRAGDARVEPCPYEVDGKKVRWLDPPDQDRARYVDDGVQGALRQVMGMSTLAQVVPGHLPDWAREMAMEDPERARWSFDMATVSIIENEVDAPVAVSLFAERGSPRDQMFRTKLARSQVIDPSRWN